MSPYWGLERGTPVDRYYVERFLWENRADISGRVLELTDSGYTNRLGVGVTQADVLDIDPANENATFVDDLATGEALPADAFDCFILTQTLHIIYDVRGAIATAHRVLRPGGVLLAGHRRNPGPGDRARKVRPGEGQQVARGRSLR